MYCVIVGCGWLCAREWDIVLCASLAVLLVRVDVCGLPGCSVSSGGLVGDRTSYRCVLVAVLVGEAAAYCLHCAGVRHLFVLSLYVALVWLMLLLLLLRLADASKYFVLRCAVRCCRRLSLLAPGAVLRLLLLLLLLLLLVVVLLLCLLLLLLLLLWLL